MIKVLFILNSLKRRGAEQQLFSFVNALPSSLSLSIFSFSARPEDFPEIFTQKKIRVYLNSHQGTYNLFRIWPLIKCLNRVRPDVVVTVGLGAALFLGRIAAVLGRTKVVYSQVNTFENFNNLPRKTGDYFDFLNKGLNVLIPRLPGTGIYRFLANSNRLSARVSMETVDYPVHTFYNGLPKEEIDRFLVSCEGDGISPIAKRINGYPTVVQVGALDENKNVIVTLQCVAHIQKEVPLSRLLIIGDGPQREFLETYVSANHLSENIVFAGQKGRADCICLMKMANVIAMTSHSESFPNVLVEGQALGLAAVTFDVGAANEIVLDGVTGYVVKPGDRNEYTRRLTELLSNDDHCREMGRKGQERVSNLFGMERKVDRFLWMVHEDCQP